MSSMRRSIAVLLVLALIAPMVGGIILLSLPPRGGNGELPVWVFNAQTQSYMFRGDPDLNNAENPTITIPSMRNGFPVTEIGSAAFRNFSHLQTVNLPNTLIEIHDNAFRDSGITTQIIPNSVRRIGYNAFRDTKYLTSVTLPVNNHFTRIFSGTFHGAISLATLDVPANVGWMEAQSLRNMPSLTTLTLRSPTPVIITGNTFQDTTMFTSPNPSVHRIYAPQLTIGLYWAEPLWAWAIGTPPLHADSLFWNIP